jgi:hypothetical protein
MARILEARPGRQAKFALAQRQRPRSSPSSSSRLKVWRITIGDPTKLATGFFAQLQRARHQDEAAPRSYQQGIARGFTKARQRAAHGRTAELKPSGGTRSAAFRKQNIEGCEQIVVGLHGSITPQNSRYMASHARIKCNSCAFRHIRADLELISTGQGGICVKKRTGKHSLNR